MKKFFLMAIMALTAFTSCQKEDEDNDYTGTSNHRSSIIGEWKATKIEATFNDGEKWMSTNFDDIRFELDGLEWITISEHHLRPMYHETEYWEEVLIPYSISNNYIVFTGSESDAKYYLQSVTTDKMVIKYIVEEFTSLVYYSKVK